MSYTDCTPGREPCIVAASLPLHQKSPEEDFLWHWLTQLVFSCHSSALISDNAKVQPIS